MKHLIAFEQLPDALRGPVLEVTEELGLECVPAAQTAVTVVLRQGERIFLSRQGDRVLLEYGRRNHLFRALSLLPDFLEHDAPVEEHCRFDLLCYMADLSRNAVYRPETARQIIRYLAICGYDSMMLYTEDTYELPGYPYFGHMRGRLTQTELRELDDYAAAFGIELIPCIQTLAHLVSALQWKAMAPVKDTEDILLVGEEQTYALIDAMLRTCRACFRSNRINIGMDEAHLLGAGEYLTRNGYRPKSEIMLEHLQRVTELCRSHGYSPMMWSDMFFRMQTGGVYRTKTVEVPQEVRALVPPEISLIYWDYYTLDRELFEHMLECHRQFDNPVFFAGGVTKWYGFAPYNALSVQSARLQMDCCAAYDIRSIIVTAWGDNGAEASQFSILPSLMYFAERAYRPGEPDADLLECRCLSCFGLGYADWLLADLPNFVGERYAGEHARINPCKYLLYNDPLTGLMDGNMDADTVAAAYRSNTERLQPLTGHPRWGYLFSTLYRLCDLLTDKSDLSVRIRRAYLAGNRAGLQEIAERNIPQILTKLDRLIDSFRQQWYRENKTFGFDIQEERLGGLRLRLQSATERLTRYLDGSIRQIEEFEQPCLQSLPGCAEGNPYCLLSQHHPAVSANKIKN